MSPEIAANLPRPGQPVQRFELAGGRGTGFLEPHRLVIMAYLYGRRESASPDWEQAATFEELTDDLLSEFGVSASQESKASRGAVRRRFIYHLKQLQKINYVEWCEDGHRSWDGYRIILTQEGREEFDRFLEYVLRLSRRVSP